MKKIIIPITVILTFSACAGGRVSIKPGYDFKQLRSVAVLPFPDFKVEQSGVMVSDMLSQYLIESGLTLVERGRLEQILGEQKLGTTGVISPDSAKELGKMMGVDAVVIGSFSGRVKRSATTVLIPAHRPLARRHFPKRPRLPGPAAQMQNIAEHAELTLTAKMVLVETGEILWAGSASGEAGSFQEAAEKAIEPIMRKVNKAIQKSLHQQ